MNINWVENTTKKQAYDSTLAFADAHGMTERNSSTVTLLYQPGSLFCLEGVKLHAELFLSDIESPAVISIEPVLTGRNDLLPNLYRSAGFKKFHLLPLYHIHIMLIEEKYEIRSQRKKWEEIIKCKQRNLFQCKYIETNLRTTSNYITKFFEEKNDNVGVIGFFVPKSIVLSEVKSEPIVIREELPNETKSFQLVESFLLQGYIERNLIKCEYPNFLIRIFVSKWTQSNSFRAQIFFADIGIRPP